jgi:hypothetical protein
MIPPPPHRHQICCVEIDSYGKHDFLVAIVVQHEHQTVVLNDRLDRLVCVSPSRSFVFAETTVFMSLSLSLHRRTCLERTRFSASDAALCSG